MSTPIPFACPACRTPLTAVDPQTKRCPQDGRLYHRIDGIWRFLLPEREEAFARFVREYETVRAAEGRGSGDDAYYRALPYRDLSGQMAQMWQQRANSFRTLLDEVIVPLENQVTAFSNQQSAISTLDLGAGNGWLAYRLAQRGHAVAAVDLTVNDFDGLGTHPYYEASFTPVQAEFARLPFPDGAVDVAIFNASFHYAVDYTKVLAEARRVLRQNGRLIIMDTPLYRDGRSGAQMVKEREAQFQAQYGVAGSALPSENYLTYRRLAALADDLGVTYQLIWPVPRWRRAVRRLRVVLRRRREPAQFPIILLHM